MFNATVHVLLVSAQAAPNLLPVLDPEIRPNEAILLISKKMKLRGAALNSVLCEAGVKTICVELDNEHDLEGLENMLMEIATGREGQQIALNVTGGTKLMALVAQSVAAAAGWDVFYVDVDTDEVIPLDREKPRKKLSAKLRLPHYLRAYGYKLKKTTPCQQPGPRSSDLLQTLVTQASSLDQALGQLNWLAQVAEGKKQLQVRLENVQKSCHGLESLLRNFEEAGVLRVEGDILNFTCEADRSFAKGGWLEYYVFRRVGALSTDLGIRDKETNLEVIDNDGVKNELDIAFLARNRLFVIECKTARMDGERAAKANDTLFKLAEVCRRVGGLGTRAMLASYRQLSDAEKRLARALGVELVCGVELARIDEKLKRWVVA